MSWTSVKKKMVDEVIEQICELGFTPHLFIYVDHPHYSGATSPINEMSILRMSVGVNAVLGYSTTDDKISFRSRVDGVVYDFEVPYDSIFGVGTKESEEMYFQMEVNIPDESVDLNISGYEETLRSQEKWRNENYTKLTESNVVEMCPGAEPWRNPNARADWASSARLV